ncbi:deoxyribodipyrimidine photo-lyase [Cronobacter sakazakii]|uniref:deoxyribodipyrimidine photo-lyase n=1 Tax=Cronobacter sakazakii TaxID=28141 RepID=UPI000B4AE529|nr:deoxyribodipyrimidine photo-lyase [Cronobacter sakazakii]EKA9345967.1 deoxyribodipyrimidine photo-lyase [Cronobacter sakazakii]EKK4043080.1 deoxyribodipyrimidine photo-lyase [Cronobacter sakazakii]ELL7786736.1 deoxyribodipyrimidine photo-lyase [Cronobacter sakazakii]ELY2562013.1 deoxyribodipyrimidine photo-lyase [Cronobacter sakazakii]ELY2753509.1 deoxyribodipyrimidine photo-lyase [Cronobacter sakazakii]
MTTHLVWFRADLRVNDNLALAAACRDPDARVIGLFIATPQQWRDHTLAPRQAAFIHQNLEALQQALAKRGIALFTREVPDFAAAVDALAVFCDEQQVSALFYNYQYELNEARRDAAVERRLEGRVACQGFDDSVMLPPGSVVTGNGEMYKVFTPYSRAFLRRLGEGLPACVSAPKPRNGGAITDVPALAPFDYPCETPDALLFPAGEEAALKRLREFCQTAAGDYPEKRDFPAIRGTSLLSAYLAIGVLSPRQCLHRLLTEHPRALEGGSGAVWLNELIWREFYRHLIVAWPHLCRHQPFIDWTARVAWQQNDAHFQAWCEGNTGYPIVDAAMRQMNATGWMHNRLRMITASFLVKDLLVDWRRGERYFMSQLIDGDFAANNGGWQWAASTGTDAAPYFRIFNPTTQGQRFDAEGEFIRRWVPELSHIPGKAVHEPHLWAKKNGKALRYPQPIVDHKQARVATLAAYEAARKE